MFANTTVPIRAWDEKVDTRNSETWAAPDYMCLTAIRLTAFKKLAIDLPNLTPALAAAALLVTGCGTQLGRPPSGSVQTSGGQTSGGTTTLTLPALSLSPASATVATGQTVSFTPPFGGVPLTWMVNGIPGGNATVGTIDGSGNYMAPLLPTGAPISVSAQLVLGNNSTPLTATGSVQIVNPAPQIAQITPGAVSLVSPQMTVTGSGFNPESAVLVNGQAVPTTYMDATHLSAQLPQNANSAAAVTVAVSNSAPGGGTTATVTLPVLYTGTPGATTHPLVARLTASIPARASIFAEFGPDTNYGRRTSTRTASSPGLPATLLVAGMRASATYHMRLHFVLEDSTDLLGEDETFTTGAVPAARVPPVTVTQSAGLSPSSGVELLDLVSGNQQEFRAAVVDLSGNLIWYYDYPLSDGIPLPIKQLSNGNMGVTLTRGVQVFQEVDLTGQVVRQITVDQLNSQLAAVGSDITLSEIHHDFAELPNGMIVLITSEIKNFTDLPGFPGTIPVLGDVLVALDPSFNIVWTWSEFDHLDVNRHPWFQLLTGQLPEPVYDWTHTNAVLYSARDKSLIVSMRMQSWVTKIDFNDGGGTGEILWRLGPGGDFTLIGGTDPFDWFYNQHYPSLVNNEGAVFDFALFDNGDTRPVDANGTWCGTTVPCYSRPVIMTIDENAKTATLGWNPHVDFSNFGGVANVLAPNRVEYTFSLDSLTNEGVVVESTMDSIPTQVLRFDTPQFCYRGVRLPSLYPGVTWDSSSK